MALVDEYSINKSRIMFLEWFMTDDYIVSSDPIDWYEAKKYLKENNMQALSLDEFTKLSEGDGDFMDYHRSYWTSEIREESPTNLVAVMIPGNDLKSHYDHDCVDHWLLCKKIRTDANAQNK
jgi:hypothetical protein